MERGQGILGADPAPTAMNDSAATTTDADVLIIGAGPSGLYACYYAGLRGLSVVMLDSLGQPGGQLMELYPHKPIFDVAGLPEVTGSALVSSLTTQAELAKPTWVLGEQAVQMLPTQRDSAVLSETGRRYTVTTDAGRRIEANGVIIAAGIGSFQPRRLPAAEDYLNRGMQYSVGNTAAYRDCDVVVVGGGDSAVDWANMLCPIARSVTLIHRRQTLTSHVTSAQQLRENNVRLMLDSQVIAAHGSEWLDTLTVRTESTQETIKAQALIAALGHIADLGPLRRWGIEFASRQIIVDSTMATNMPGVFAIGDVTTYPGKVRIMAVGFGEAATAVNNLAAQLNPGQPIFPGHSTDLMGK